MHSELPYKTKPLSPAQRMFCEGIIRGLTATKAYLLAYPETKQKSAEANASRLIRTDRIKAELELIRRMAALVPGSAVLSLAEKREKIARIVRAKPSDASYDNPDCNLVMTKAGPVALFPDKLAAIKLDNELCGDSATKTLRLEIVAASQSNEPPVIDIESERVG